MDELLVKDIKVDYVILGKPTAEQYTIMKTAMDAIRTVINNPKLREYILNHSYPSNGRTISGFAQTTKSNKEILRRFLDGDERNGGNPDNMWSFIINFYYKGGSRVIGYTNTGSKQINLNTKFMGRKPHEIVNTLVHEMTHLLGMEHSYKRSSQWKYTAPYVIGGMCEDLAAELLGVQIPAVNFEPRTSLWRRFLNIFR